MGDAVTNLGLFCFQIVREYEKLEKAFNKVNNKRKPKPPPEPPAANGTANGTAGESCESDGVMATG